MITGSINPSLERLPCPAKGDRCELCLEIGDKAMRDALVNSCHWSITRAAVAVENYPLQDLSKKLVESLLWVASNEENAPQGLAKKPLLT